MKQGYEQDKLFYHIWPWSVTLTLELATAHNLMMVNMCVKLNLIPAYYEGVMDWSICFITSDLGLHVHWIALCIIAMHMEFKFQVIPPYVDKVHVLGLFFNNT